MASWFTSPSHSIEAYLMGLVVTGKEIMSVWNQKKNGNCTRFSVQPRRAHTIAASTSEVIKLY